MRLRCLLIIAGLLGLAQMAHATPFFARTYHFSCETCHSGFPRLNEFGLAFKANGFRIPGAEKQAPLAWQKTIPLAVQVEPTLERFSPVPNESQFTDTQLLAGGLITRSTSFYIHDSLWIDADPTMFPSYEAWAQQVLNERYKLMVKVGQFELPFAYSPAINRITVFQPLVFGVGVDNNDVRLGAPLRGIQLSGLVPDKLRWYVDAGAPSLLSTGNTIGQKEFLGKFPDLFVRVSNADLRRNIGVFGYITSLTSNPNDPSTHDHGQRIGIDGNYYWQHFQFYGMLVYGVNSNPINNGKDGVLRSGFIEADRMLLPWFGLTGRVEAQTIGADGQRAYAQAYTLSARLYPVRNLRLSAEYQQNDHRHSGTALMAGISF